MPGPNFSVTPTWVYPEEERYNVLTTQSENYNKEYYLLSTTPNRRYRLVFSGVTDTTYNNAILQHWRDVSGPYQAFYWLTVPSYINGGGGSGVTMYGRWIAPPKWTPKTSTHWFVDMLFEKDV